MNTFQLECFYRVASTLNFARAAEELNVTQPAVTHQIRSLEDELGVKLFNRTTRSVSLTHEGEMLLVDAKDLVIRFEAIKNKFSGAEKEIVPFRIGCIDDTLFGLLPDVLFRLSSFEPNVHPILCTFPAPQLAKCMDEGFADVALAIQEKLPKGSRLKYEELGKTSLVCVCDGTHPLSERESITLGELEDTDLIFFRPALCGPEVTALQGLLGRGRHPESIFFCDSLNASFTLAKAGYGALIIPRVLVPDFVPDLIKVPVADYQPISFGVYCKEDAGKLARQFIALLKAQIDDMSARGHAERP